MKYFKLRLIILFIIVSLISVGCSYVPNANKEKVKEIKKKTISKEFEEKLSLIEVNYLSEEAFPYEALIEEELNEDIIFQNKYTELEGVLTFRGNNHRNQPAYGVVNIKKNKLEEVWKFNTSSSTWGGGAGWTGQPSIIKWPKDIRESMNIKYKFKKDDNFTEAIYASLDGNIYFFDLKTGEESREKIRVGNPIKGSLSIDPRGYPLLYVGEGINENGIVGFNIYSLIDGAQLYELGGNDPNAFRGWPAFDSSSLINSESDSVVLGGENGLFYVIKLNSNYNKEKNTISIDPKINRYRFSSSSNRGRLGIENSVATYANLAYFADNNGILQCIDINKLKPVWSIDVEDDTDSSLTLDIEGNIPYIYTGNEVDHQGSRGISTLRKISGLTGEIIWEREFECESLLGKKPNNGGVLATNVVGKNDINNLVIFSLARYNGFNRGLTIALDKNTGDTIWEKEFDNYMWSSPVDVYDKEKKGYIIQCDSAGNIHLIAGKSGDTLNTITLNGNIESSPAIFNDTLVVATRAGSMYGIKLK